MALFSACVASVVRCYYSVKMSRSEDITYYVGLVALWTSPEMASGILSVCLPVSPRFFRHLKVSHLWSGLGSSLRSFFRPKTEATWNPGTHLVVDDNKASKLPEGSRSFGIEFLKYNILSDDTELVTPSKGGSSDLNTRDKQLMKGSSNLREGVVV